MIKFNENYFSISKLLVKNNCNYHNIYYNNNIIKINLNTVNIQSVKCNLNNKLLSLILDDINFNYIKSIENKIIEYFVNNFKNESYRNNFFSSINKINSINILNINVDKNLHIETNSIKKYKVFLEINGMWVKEGMYGISYKFMKIVSTD